MAISSRVTVTPDTTDKQMTGLTSWRRWRSAATFENKKQTKKNTNYTETGVQFVWASVTYNQAFVSSLDLGLSHMHNLKSSVIILFFLGEMWPCGWSMEFIVIIITIWMWLTINTEWNYVDIYYTTIRIHLGPSLEITIKLSLISWNISLCTKSIWHQLYLKTFWLYSLIGSLFSLHSVYKHLLYYIWFLNYIL